MVVVLVNAATERWLQEVFEEADAIADKGDKNITDAGTWFFGQVSRRIPMIELVMPMSHQGRLIDPRGHPERIPWFYMWLRSFYD